ncbi:hypothetical protein [Sphingobium sp. LB126]|uniref:hypothetical protein n=1 Tax=Sphingobium sp. LB126 TaxID=1983755 RepID=UPI001F5B3FC2|nr:hypothetical protein [Sphingobium sp. LB126]
MSDALTPEEERDALAAELALGVLAGPERAAALRCNCPIPLSRAWCRTGKRG